MAPTALAMTAAVGMAWGRDAIDADRPESC
jgi:hypothetical protein